MYGTGGLNVEIVKKACSKLMNELVWGWIPTFVSKFWNERLLRIRVTPY